ncbi:MAG: HAMP domain-containing histidine kinase [Leptolyngbya sp. SIO1E4]|nr:HAMP domain-containing histidine kinase [Leptolyngbya sp. SIO1E4]
MGFSAWDLSGYKIASSQAILGMEMPPLSQFIHSVPKSLLSNDPTQWLEDCLAGGVDRLVLVDDHAVPVRVVPLQHLLSLAETWKSPTASVHEAAQDGGGAEVASSFPEEAASLALAEYSLRAIALIPVTQLPETAARMIAAAPETDWVVVDQQQRYLGLLDKTNLLAAAFIQQLSRAELHPEVASPPADAPASETESDAATQRQLSQNNTALLTYLGHELKTPLTSLLGLSSLLGTGRLGELSARQVRYVSLIQQHCRRLAAWVNTLIDLGRIDSGSLRLIPNRIELPTIWREAYRQAALRVGWEEAKVPTMPQLLRSDDTSVTLVADSPRLQQILTCLMQSALVIQSTSSDEVTEFPLTLEVWDHWVAFVLPGLDEDLRLDQLSQTTSTLPFSTAPAALTAISTEMGHVLEWLLARKLAQLHGGELVLIAHTHYGVCPTLLLPTTPALMSPQNSRLLLLVAPATGDYVKTIQQQATQLNYRSLITQQIKDAVEIASHVALAAILVLIEGPQSVSDLRSLQANLKPPQSLIIALVPPQWSALLGELPADRELLWPANSLGSVLLQPPSSVPAPNRLTILYLKTTAPETDRPDQKQAEALRLPSIFHDFGCRVLEVDDLEQAGILRRVWHPDVAVLDPTIADPATYLQTLSQSPDLDTLPLITLTMAATQAAHELASLTVFPCLVGETSWDTPEASDRMAAWLIQVLQVAATHSD